MFSSVDKDGTTNIKQQGFSARPLNILYSAVLLLPQVISWNTVLQQEKKQWHKERRKKKNHRSKNTTHTQRSAASSTKTKAEEEVSHSSFLLSTFFLLQTSSAWKQLLYWDQSLCISIWAPRQKHSFGPNADTVHVLRNWNKALESVFLLFLTLFWLHAIYLTVPTLVTQHGQICDWSHCLSCCQYSTSVPQNSLSLGRNVNVCKYPVVFVSVSSESNHQVSKSDYWIVSSQGTVRGNWWREGYNKWDVLQRFQLQSKWGYSSLREQVTMLYYINEEAKTLIPPPKVTQPNPSLVF